MCSILFNFDIHITTLPSLLSAVKDYIALAQYLFPHGIICLRRALICKFDTQDQI